MKNTKAKNETTPEPTPAPEPTPVKTAEPQTVPVFTRFTREELDAMQDETGANADATAVACFVRKNLRKRA